MVDVIIFTPRREADAQNNLADFIRQCRDELTVFGADLTWEQNYWRSAGVSFGNIDQKTRVLDEANVFKSPFLEFAKAYFRYQQGVRPNQTRMEMRGLKCIERALVARKVTVDVRCIDMSLLDDAANIARQNYVAEMAYRVGREIARIARFLSDHHLVPGSLDWQSPIAAPLGPNRTGRNAKEARDRKLPPAVVLDALAEIFSSRPTAPNDIFTTSASTLLLCAPSRVGEIMSLPLDCEVTDKTRGGVVVYGWRFIPSKGGEPMIKWIPPVLEDLAKEAIRRIREMTNEARRIAAWLEAHPDRFYRHAGCPDVLEDQPLTAMEAATAMGLHMTDAISASKALWHAGLPYHDGENSLASLNIWIRARLPKDFPWFDERRNLRYSKALFCLQLNHLRRDTEPRVFMIVKPNVNTLNFDLGPRKIRKHVIASVFERYGFLAPDGKALKVTSHQFRHLINTVGQRGGLSQSEIARWSGRADTRQNSVYDHMSEFELVDMLRAHDDRLSLSAPLEEIAKQVSAKIPMTRQEFMTLTIPTAHITEFGFCVHDFAMAPCQRFRDCLNCTEQVCIKGDRRLEGLKVRHIQTKKLLQQADKEIADGTAGADRWYEIHSLTEKRLDALIKIAGDPTVCDGAIVRLSNGQEFSPLRRAMEAKSHAGTLSPGQVALLGGCQRLAGPVDG